MWAEVTPFACRRVAPRTAVFGEGSPGQTFAVRLRELSNSQEPLAVENNLDGPALKQVSSVLPRFPEVTTRAMNGHFAIGVPVQYRGHQSAK